MVSIFPYSDIHKERIRIFDSEHCSFFKEKGKKFSTRELIRKIKNMHYHTVKKYQCKGITVAITKMLGLGFKHTKGNAKNLNFCISLNVVWLFYTIYN